MSAKRNKSATKALMFGGKKAAATPRHRSVSDTNTRHMAMSTWTPGYMRGKRG